MVWTVAVIGRMSAQDLVYLEHCETLSFDQDRLPDAQLLKGDVRFRHENALMYCDSAYFYEKTNSFDAFGHIRFVQGDTLEGFGDVLYYNGNTRLARLRRNVRLVHITTVLQTDSMNYNRNENLAYYFTGGTIVDDVNQLSSVWGSYCPSTHRALFHDSVHLQNESFTLDADTLVYNTATNIANLVCPTTIVYEDKTTILSSDGWYNTSTERSMLLSRSLILHADGKQLTGDTIYYDKKIGLGNVFGHMEMQDTVQKMTLLGNYGIVHEKEKSGFATDSAYMIDWSQEKKTYIHADTLFTEQIPFVDTVIVAQDSIWVDSVLVAQVPDTVYRDSLYRQVRAFHTVRAYNEEFQFVCDSMVYCGKDSIATMYKEPVCWSKENQISADTIFVYVVNGAIDHAHGVGAALGIKQEGPDEFDQLSGQELTAYIRNGELKEVLVSGNAETIFYPRDADSSYVGVNKSQSSYVDMFFEKNKIHHVLFTTETTGTLYPMSQIEWQDTRLLGFFWAQQERPTGWQDIFSDPPRTARPVQKAISASEEEEEEPVMQTKIKRNKRKKEI